MIITPGRCGSEHLLQTLNNYEDINMDGEVFNRSNFSHGSFNSYVQSNGIRRLTAYFFNREKLSHLKVNFPMQWLIAEFLSGNKNAGTRRGFKLTLDQWLGYPAVLDQLLKEKVQVLYLSRKDWLSMTISLIEARTSGTYHQKKAPIPSRALDKKTVARLLMQFNRWEEVLTSKISQKNSFLLCYEDLFQNYPQVLQSIRHWLQLEENVEPRLSDLKKTTPDLKEWVGNLEEIETYLDDLGIEYKKTCPS